MLGLHVGRGGRCVRTLSLVSGLLGLGALSVGARAQSAASHRTVLFDFEDGSYTGWELRGNCWTGGPATGDRFNGQITGFAGQFFACTLHTRLGNAATGHAMSRPFAIDKPVLSFLIAGGRHPEVTCLNLYVGGKVVATATGDGTPVLREKRWNVTAYIGQTGRVEIVDESSSEQRGYIAVDQIELRDDVTPPPAETEPGAAKQPALSASSPRPEAPTDALFRDLFAVRALRPASKLTFTEVRQADLPGKGRGTPAEVLGSIGIALRQERGKYWSDNSSSGSGYSVTQGAIADDQRRLAEPLEAYRISKPRYATGTKRPLSHNDLFVKLPPKAGITVYEWRRAGGGRSADAAIPLTNGVLVQVAHLTGSSAKASFVRVPGLTLNDIADELTLVLAPDGIQLDPSTRLSGAARGSLLRTTPLGSVGRYTYDLAGMASLDDDRQDDRAGPAPVYGKNHRLTLLPTRDRSIEVAFHDRSAPKARVLRISAGHEVSSIDLPVAHGYLGAICRDRMGDYLYFTCGSGTNPPASVVRCTAAGALKARNDLANASDEYDLYGLGDALCNLACADGVVCLVSSRTMQDGGDGLHHQGSFAAMFRSDDLRLIKNLGQNSGHSFENRLTFDGSCFVSLDLGDNYPRGIIIHKMLPTEKVGRVVFTYKTALGTTPHPHRNGKDGQPIPAGKWSNDNRTYTELGDAAPTPNGYLVLFASERSTDNSLATSDLNEPRNVGMVLVTRGFERVHQEQDVVSPGLVRTRGEGSPKFGFYTFDGDYVAQQNSGVVWLTRYDDRKQSTAARPKLVDIGRGRYMVLWERWTDRKYVATQALLIDEMGKPLSDVIDLGADARLPRGERPIYYQDRIVWPAARGTKLALFVWDLSGAGPDEAKQAAPVSD